MPILKATFQYIVPNLRWVLLILFCTFLEATFMALSPLSFKYLLDEAFIPKDVRMFLIIILVLLISGSVAIAAGYILDYVKAFLSGRISSTIRQKAFSSLQRMPFSQFDRFGTGMIVSRFSNDVNAISEIVAHIIPNIFSNVISITFGILLLLNLQWKLTVLMLLCSTLLFVAPLLLKNKSKTASEIYKQKMEDFIDLVDESSKGHRLIKAYLLADFMEENANSRIKTIWKSDIKMNYLFALMGRIPVSIQILLSTVLLSVGGYFILQGQLTVGEFIAMNTLFITVSNAILSFSNLWPQLFEAEVSFNRINELMIKNNVEKIGANKSLLPPDKIDDIRMENVDYYYQPTVPALKNVSLTVPAKGLTMFVGSSGSGKSTALNLLLGFNTPTKGNIYYGDIELNQDMDEKSFFEQVAVVFQDSFLFNMSIKDNIMLNHKSMPLETIVAATKQAQIHDTITALPEQYNTILKNNASNLSGGQKQRISIARALAKNPKYLFLDEASSALDPETEAAINQMILELRGHKTIVSVTHRLHSAIHADKIFVFQKGQIIEVGTHEELLQLNGLYKRFWDKQTGFEISSDGFNAKITVNRLAQFPFFQNLDVDVLVKLSKQFITEKYETGQTIISEGDSGNKFYIIVRGTVDILKTINGSQRSVATLEDGDHFGEIALLRDIPRTATVTAKSPSIILSLHRDQLLELVQTNDEIYEMLEASIVARN